MLTVFSFGDSILDRAHYNDHGVDPAGLLVSNRDDLFPEFRGRDLATLVGGPVPLVRRARDGSTVRDLPRQALDLDPPAGPSLALLTIGGNDLMAGLLRDDDDFDGGFEGFAAGPSTFPAALPIRPVLVGTVYDPTFGEDSAAASFLQMDTAEARRNFDRMNATLATLAPRFGLLVDLRAHFLNGRPDRFVRTLEPSLVGASEVRRVFLDAIERAGSIHRQ